jgi:molybdopterin converting factor small subunit
MADLEFLGYLAEVAGSRTRQFKLDAPKRLQELLPSAFPKTNIIVLVNQRAISLDSLIRDEDSVIIMPILSGG